MCSVRTRKAWPRISSHASKAELKLLKYMLENTCCTQTAHNPKSGFKLPFMDLKLLSRSRLRCKSIDCVVYAVRLKGEVSHTICRTYVGPHRKGVNFSNFEPEYSRRRRPRRVRHVLTVCAIGWRKGRNRHRLHFFSVHSQPPSGVFVQWPASVEEPHFQECQSLFLS